MAPSSKPAAPPYAKDEKVLCFHHDMLYEAKIIEIDSTEEGGFRYKIHYKGWKATWDDWVPQDRIRKLNDENRELAAQLNQQARASMQKKSGPAKKAGLKNGSDFSSARGSEERSGAAATMSGRGRKRDFDLENDSVQLQHYSFMRSGAQLIQPLRLSNLKVNILEHVAFNGHSLFDHLPIITRSEPLQTVPSLTIHIDLMDAAFVKKEANWYKASLRYDNLSKLPPETLSQSNPEFKTALHDFYFTSTDEGLVSNFIANDYRDPWPVPYKRAKPKKREETPESEEELTAGIPPKDREEFNEELRSFMQENCPSDLEDLPDPIVTKTAKAEKAKKAVINREKRAAAKARSIMPPPQHTRNTRLRAKASQATTAAADVQAPTGDATATQDATTTVAAPDADEDTMRSRQRSEPPFNLFMRDTRAAMTQNTFSSRPVLGVVPKSYYAAMNNAYNSVYPKARSLGDEPIGNDIPRAPANAQEPSKPEATTTTTPENTTVPKKSAASRPTARKTPAPKAAATKTAAPKKLAPTKSTATKTVASKAASVNTANSSVGKDKSAVIKLPRATKACDPCRAHKTRCTGGTPCEACVRRGFNCVYVPGGRKTPMKRAREDSQEIVKKELLDQDAEQEGRPAKRARKEKAASTKKDSANGSDGTAEALNSQPSKILPSIEELPEDSEGPNVRPSKMQHLSQANIGKNAMIQPTKIQSSYSGRITRSRSRQLSEEAEAQTAKLQYKGKRAREETEEPHERPAKLQRATRKGPNYRKPDGNPQILRAIDSMSVNSEGDAQTDSPWEGYDYEATWMSHTYMEWEKSLDWPDLNLKSQDESFHARPSIKLVMTDVLKGILVDDWEHVTKDSQLVPLPHEQPVAKILNDYLEDEMPKREEDSAQVDILKETIAGLREYFDRALGRILLYRFERLQYSELLPQWENEKDGGPSSVYGGEHLCRLLVSLPELLAQTNMDQQSVSRLREELTKFTNWLSKNGQKYFVREYEVPGPEYQEKAKSS
ncbi:Esa1p-associated factor [Diaporthe eres]